MKFFNCYFSAPRPSLGHWRGYNPTHINEIYIKLLYGQ